MSEAETQTQTATETESRTGTQTAMRCTCDELPTGGLGCPFCEIEVPAFVRGHTESDFQAVVSRVQSQADAETETGA